MPIAATGLQPGSTDPGTIAALAASDGCARHPHVAHLTAPNSAGRDLADAIHVLCAVHGRTGNLFDAAARNPIPTIDQAWIVDAAAAYADERAYLAALTAAVGPLPSTPGQPESDSAFVALRHAFDTLAESGRTGCAMGAAIALLIDWQTFRRIFDAAAARVGMEVQPCQLPVETTIVRIGPPTDASPALQRAMRFGAQQTFAQHRGMVDLIAARANAREAH